ncbi:hypothetical protein KO361_06160 [Candidatus Woesearchaeota archaeon]|nr:hypothetical protein [Candidatus Woesearchaeota archaeon]
MGKRKTKNYQKKDNTPYIVGGVMIIITTILVIAIIQSTNKTTNETGEFDEFAKCLTEQGTIFYGTEWCGFCQQQKALFGASMQHINFIDCDQNRNLCSSEGITGYPTWKIKEQLYPGVQQLTRLSEISGCELFA